MRNATALAPLPGEYLSPAPVDDDFTGLFRAYHPQLFRYVTHHFGPRDADEITQESLTRALRSLDRGRSEAETWAWLIRVARNVATDLARSRRICEATDDDEVLKSAPIDETALPEPAALLDERRRVVRTALKMLPPAQRRILFLYEVDELSCPTIARLMGSSEDTVRKTLQRARRSFAKQFRAISGGVFGSWVAVLRGFRRVRRARGLSSLTSSTAVCAFAGTVALTVTGAHPGIPTLAPRLVAPAASTFHDTERPEIGRAPYTRAVSRSATPAATPRFAAPSGGVTGPHVSVPKAKVPSSPFRSGGEHLRFHLEAGPFHFDNDLGSYGNGGALCHLGTPFLDCS